MTTSKQVITTYLFISGGYTLAAAFIWGINTLFLLDTGMSVSEVFIVNAFFSAGIMLFELPTGIVADNIGRRISFLASVLVLAVTTMAYVLCPMWGGGFWAFCIISVFMGLGFTFYSGAVEAWLVDALKATDYNHNLDQVFTRGAFISGAAMLLGTVAGGFFGDLDLKLPYVIRGGLLAFVFLLSYFFMKEIGYEPQKLTLKEAPKAMKESAKLGVQFGWRQPAMRLFVVCAAVQGGAMSFIFYAWQPYFLELLNNQELVWVAGVIAALISVSTMIGNSIVEWFSRFCGKRTTLLLWGTGVQALATLAMGLIDNFYAAAGCLLLVTGAMGMMGPIRQAYVHSIVPSEQRATVVSFDSMIAGLGSTGGQPGLGYIAQTHSFGFGYVISGVILVIAFPLMYLVRRLKENADIIIGKKATVKGGCPAQGIPQISQLDAKTTAG